MAAMMKKTCMCNLTTNTICSQAKVKAKANHMVYFVGKATLAQQAKAPRSKQPAQYRNAISYLAASQSTLMISTE